MDRIDALSGYSYPASYVPTRHLPFQPSGSADGDPFSALLTSLTLSPLAERQMESEPLGTVPQANRRLVEFLEAFNSRFSSALSDEI
ncbi:MAG: hypothetical protein HYU64_18775 [Armatimonadetes bacterium]|nr:hypothetical protein [Armatimonadota bacterium]